ncbi:MAG: hypothetical protein CVU09_06700 [Bacteroidetes bacterium HGW-Bacteroidetes-4]|jgi:hypothetical protein|nr:MAG: hypothetical protein CVU09_06700 [Bacteroidetes bacterium HGW-Bacteroidetes-4]
MFKQKKIRQISIILLVLVMLLGWLTLKEKKQGQRSFKAYVVETDTAKVNRIEIFSGKLNESVTLNKVNHQWMLSIENNQVQADGQLIDELLSQLYQLKPKRIAGTQKQSWAGFELTDSLATRVVLKSDKKKLTDLLVGKFTYSQGQSANPYQQQNMIVTSYVRPYNEDFVYAVDGFLSMMVNRGNDSFRKRNLISGNPEQWLRLSYNLSNGESYALQKTDGKWYIQQQLADSATVHSYLKSLGRLSGQKFAKKPQDTSSLAINSRLTIETENNTSIEVKAGLNSLGEEIYISSQNQGNAFTDSTLSQQLFVDKAYFLK